MGILCDTQIRQLIGIEPFEENLKRPGKVSYGVSSYGYDVRVGSQFKIFTNVNSQIIDPKRFSDTAFVAIDTDQTGKDHILIPPNSFALCATVETVTMPRGYLAICVGKSTYARCGIIVNVTPIEPEWRGKITLEISEHHAPAGEDLRQRGDRPSRSSSRASSRAPSATPTRPASTRTSRG